jgi:hypothetical protein
MANETTGARPPNPQPMSSPPFSTCPLPSISSVPTSISASSRRGAPRPRRSVRFAPPPPSAHAEHERLDLLGSRVFRASLKLSSSYSLPPQLFAHCFFQYCILHSPPPCIPSVHETSFGPLRPILRYESLEGGPPFICALFGSWFFLRVRRCVRQYRPLDLVLPAYVAAVSASRWDAAQHDDAVFAQTRSLHVIYVSS